MERHLEVRVHERWKLSIWKVTMDVLPPRSCLGRVLGDIDSEFILCKENSSVCGTHFHLRLVVYKHLVAEVGTSGFAICL